MEVAQVGKVLTYLYLCSFWMGKTQPPSRGFYLLVKVLSWVVHWLDVAKEMLRLKVIGNDFQPYPLNTQSPSMQVR